LTLDAAAPSARRRNAPSSLANADRHNKRMESCCEIRSEVPAHQRRVLRIVLWLNAVMFAAEFGAGLVAHSTALLADSVDMLGDAIIYGFSLYAIARGEMWQARAALLKGLIMAAFGIGVLTEVIHKLATGVVPTADIMSVVAIVALAANTVCLWLLSRHRAHDINMRSAWLCSRNDVIANVGVLLAAGAVGRHSFWMAGHRRRSRHRGHVRQIGASRHA
jgi:Co/Zn/Cd efflux system component